MKLVIFDFNKTLYDPAVQQLFPGTLATLGHFKTLGVTLVLLSTESESRVQLFKKLGIATYFDKTNFVAKKTAVSIKTIIDSYDVAPQDVLIIGDDPDGELLAAYRLHVPAIAVGTGFCDKPAAHQLGVAFCSSIKDVPEAKL